MNFSCQKNMKKKSTLKGKTKGNKIGIAWMPKFNKCLKENAKRRLKPWKMYQVHK